MKVFALGLAAILETTAGYGAGFSAWADSTRVQLNTTSAGAGVATDQTSFPVLVRFFAADFIFSEAKSDGSDLRFADSTGTSLPYDLERFDPINKLAEAWVLIPIVKGNAATQWFKMYWGNPAATAASSGPGVFPSSGNYTAVWHLTTNGGTTAGAFRDASSHGNHGTGVAMDSTSVVSGAVAAATRFVAASNQGISVPHNASLHPSGSGTVEAWIKSTSQASYKRFICKPFSSAAAPWNEYSLESDVSGIKAVFGVTIADSQVSVTATTAMANGTWYHIVGTYDGATQKIYVNGALEASRARTGSVSDYGQALAIGKSGIDNNSNFDGAVDEARVSSTARSADWIKLCYANQKAGQKLVTFQRFPSCQTQFAMPADTAIAEGSALLLTAQTACATGYFWSIVSGPAPRILDPEVKGLQVQLPRVAADTAIVYRFTANFGDTVRTGDVRVSIRETIPDPAFTFPSLPAWSGSEPLVVKPTVTNAASLQAGDSPPLHFAWSLSDIPADSTLGADFITLSHPAKNGILTIGLCLDNGSAVACKETTVTVSGSGTVGLAPMPGVTFASGVKHRWDAKGRAKTLRPRR